MSNRVGGEYSRSGEVIVDNEICINVVTASGECFAKATCQQIQIIADLKSSLCIRGTRVEAIFKNDRELLDGESITHAGLVNGDELLIIVAGEPLLHCFNPSSSQEQSQSWGYGFDRRILSLVPLVVEGVQYHGMETAPDIGRKIAEEMSGVASNLETTPIRVVGEIIVISNPGPDPLLACKEALGLVQHLKLAEDYIVNLDERISSHNMDFCDNSVIRFHRDFLAITKIMTEHLTKHFFFSVRASVAPIIYGGYASDGSIVGLLETNVDR